MLSIKYKPKIIEEFIGNEVAIKTLTKWLLDWQPNTQPNNKCAFIYGSNGIGKSLMVDLVLEKYNYNILMCNNETNIETIIQTQSLSSKKNIIVYSDIDEIDNFKKNIDKSQIPIIFIGDNKFNKSLQPILKYCYEIKMFSPKDIDIYIFLKKITKQEKISILPDDLMVLVEQSNGDIRFMLNQLQICMTKSEMKDYKNENIFETTKELFSKKSFEDKYNIYWLNNDLHCLMVQENYINNISSLDNLSISSNALSESDMFNKWELQPYVAFNVIHSTFYCNELNKINFTQLLSKYSKINKGFTLSKTNKETKTKEKKIKEKKTKAIPKKK
jgi:DNA polymerase III delta prime subunit